MWYVQECIYDYNNCMYTGSKLQMLDIIKSVLSTTERRLRNESAMSGGQKIQHFFTIKGEDFLFAVVFRRTLVHNASRFQLLSGVLSSRLHQSSRLTKHWHSSSDKG